MIGGRTVGPSADERPTMNSGPYRIRCVRRHVVYELGADRMLSTHRTSEGTVTYLRCPCGDVVVDRAGHRLSADDVDRVVPRSPSMHDYLSQLQILNEGLPPVPGARELLHETCSLLAKAAAEAGIDLALPAPTDPDVVHLRLLGRLAGRIAGREIRVHEPYSCRLDSLVPELVRPARATRTAGRQGRAGPRRTRRRRGRARV